MTPFGVALKGLLLFLFCVILSVRLMMTAFDRSSVMAQAPQVSQVPDAGPVFAQDERLWLEQALRNQIKMLTRSRSNEIVGSEIHALRGREIAAVNSLLAKIGGLK